MNQFRNLLINIKLFEEFDLEVYTEIQWENFLNKKTVLELRVILAHDKIN